MKLAGPFAIGTFSVPGRDAFAGLVAGGRVRDLTAGAGDMIFGVARLVSYASQITTLLPGDLALTGSPAGNGLAVGRLLRPGDVIEATITGLGAQRTRCVAEQPEQRSRS